MTDNDIEVYRGDTRTVEVTITDSDDAAVDLTDYECTFTVKNSKNDPDSKAIIQRTGFNGVDPSLGVTVFSLTSTDTDNVIKTYDYDVQIYNDTTKDVKTVIVGKFRILQDVTKTVG
jgi:hypothetical protein